MFNEEFRSVLRRNLVATDPGDVVSEIVFDVTNVLKESGNPDVVAGGLPFAG
jgi:hypothetical protein